MNFRNLTFRGRPVFYGWIIVAGLGLVTMVSMGMLGVNFGLYIEPMSRELGVGQGFFGWAQSGRQIGSALSGFILGRILDRYGARWSMAIAGLLLCAAMIAMGNVTAGWQIVAIFVIMGLLGLQGAGGNLYTVVTISNWFVRKRSKAMSRVFLGTPMGIFFLAPLTAFMIEHIGWRNATIILGIMGGVIVFSVAVLVRRRPEDMGQRIDGGRLHENTDGTIPTQGDESKPENPVPVVEEYSWTRGQALRSSAFWKLSVAFGLAMFALSTTNLFRVPHFVSKGIDPQLVAYSLSFEAVVVFAVTIPIGYAAARFQLRYILIASHLISIGFILLMFVSTEGWHVFLANALFGVSATSQMIVQGVLWPDYFGKGNIGVIRGLTIPVTTALSFAGPPLAGTLYDIYGSYTPAWITAIGLIVASGALFLITPKPSAPQDAAVPG